MYPDRGYLVPLKTGTQGKEFSFEVKQEHLVDRGIQAVNDGVEGIEVKIVERAILARVFSRFGNEVSEFAVCAKAEELVSGVVPDDEVIFPNHDLFDFPNEGSAAGLQGNIGG